MLEDWFFLFVVECIFSLLFLYVFLLVREFLVFGFLIFINCFLYVLIRLIVDFFFLVVKYFWMSFGFDLIIILFICFVGWIFCLEFLIREIIGLGFFEFFGWKKLKFRLILFKNINIFLLFLKYILKVKCLKVFNILI